MGCPWPKHNQLSDSPLFKIEASGLDAPSVFEYSLSISVRD